MAVSNTNDIIMETTEEAISDEYLDNLILAAVKSVWDIKKHLDCLFIYDYLSKSQVLKLLKKLTANNKFKNKPANGKGSCFIINETPFQDRNPPNPGNSILVKKIAIRK